MLLVTAATDLEIADLREQFADSQEIAFLITGVGLVETACTLTTFLERQGRAIRGVINIGVGGAYHRGKMKILDLGLATSEVIGDMAVCFENRLDPLGSPELVVHHFFPCQGSLRDQFLTWCFDNSQEIHDGPFVSVNCVSGTRKRGEILAATYKSISENMEGAAVARVCKGYGLDWLEIRCMSNMVEDRDTSTWRLAEAAAKCSLVTGQFLTDYLHAPLCSH